MLAPELLLSVFGVQLNEAGALVARLFGVDMGLTPPSRLKTAINGSKPVPWLVSLSSGALGAGDLASLSAIQQLVLPLGQSIFGLEDISLKFSAHWMVDFTK